MYSAATFDGKLYTAYIWTIGRNYQDRRPQDLTRTPLTAQMTHTWLEAEFYKALQRDEMDPFYSENVGNRDALDDVSRLTRGTYVIVLDEEKNFFGKIEIMRKDAIRTLNSMYLYVSGDRRRLGRVPGQTPSARIVWHFVAQLSCDIYGDLARILIPYPRTSIYKNLIRYGATFVTLVGNMIDSTINPEDKLETHEILRKHVSGELESEIENWGALFSAPQLLQQRVCALHQ